VSRIASDTDGLVDAFQKAPWLHLEINELRPLVFPLTRTECDTTARCCVDELKERLSDN